jgi:hypothetical protein
MIDRLSRFLFGLSFQRGLALGALVGAAIAGSTLWTRLAAGKRQDSPSGEPGAADEPGAAAAP